MTTSYALGAIILYVGNLFLVPLFGITFFLILAVAMNLINLPFVWNCANRPKWN